MHPKANILSYPLKPAIGSPSVGPERDRYSLSEVVSLQTGATDSGHDARIVNDAHWCRRLRAASAKDQIGVCCGGERVTDDKKGDVGSRCFLKNFGTLQLDHFAVRKNYGLSIQRFLSWSTDVC